MREEILINLTPQETRVATVQEGELQEISIERVQHESISGNIYVGVVVRVLPGMKAAFIDIGLERSAFVHAKDLISQASDGSALRQSQPKISISSMLSEGQRILVQVVKDALGNKGARLTGRISIPARNVVFLPETNYLEISKRIRDLDVREKLLALLKEQVVKVGISGGFIVRTSGENVTADELESELKFLSQIWEKVVRKQKRVKAPALVYQDLPLVMRTIRDMAWQGNEKIRVDSQEKFNQIKAFVEELKLDVTDRIEYYSDDRPIFELYGIEEELRNALHKKVTLKSGGYLIIDQAEAMTTIDVNTGSFIGNRNPEETILMTNLEAAITLARQLRIRNLGGIIIVDFIDMAKAEHIEQVMQALKIALARDSKLVHTNEMTSLGIVEITRKRTGKSLEGLLMEPCIACNGRGVHKTPETTCYEIFREILHTAREFDAGQFLIRASQNVIDLLLGQESHSINDLALVIKKEITLQAVPSYTQEQYEVILK